MWTWVLLKPQTLVSVVMFYVQGSQDLILRIASFWTYNPTNKPQTTNYRKNVQRGELTIFNILLTSMLGCNITQILAYYIIRYIEIFLYLLYAWDQAPIPWPNGGHMRPDSQGNLLRKIKSRHSGHLKNIRGRGPSNRLIVTRVSRTSVVINARSFHSSI